MKETIISCDLCGDHISSMGFITEDGAVGIRAKQVQRVIGCEGLIWMAWKRRTIHICPECVDKLKAYCKENEMAIIRKNTACRTTDK